MLTFREATLMKLQMPVKDPKYIFEDDVQKGEVSEFHIRIQVSKMKTFQQWSLYIHTPQRSDLLRQRDV